MRKATRRVPTSFALETHFGVPVTSVPFRGAPELELEQLKHRLLQPLLQDASKRGLHLPLQRAATEAATLAWLTPYPLLVLPLLLEEKATAALRQAERQEEIRKRSERLLKAVA